jgi:predicted nucleic acid-binding protein
LIYLDTSVLLVYTLTESIEIERSKSVRRLFAKVDSGLVSAATSFYALHEVYVFALENAPDLEVGSQLRQSSIAKNPKRTAADFTVCHPDKEKTPCWEIFSPQRLNGRAARYQRLRRWL